MMASVLRPLKPARISLKNSTLLYAYLCTSQEIHLIWKTRPATAAAGEDKSRNFPAELPGIVLIEPEIHVDSRG